MKSVAIFGDVGNFIDGKRVGLIGDWTLRIIEPIE
jgi:hypothetical protein